APAPFWSPSSSHQAPPYRPRPPSPQPWHSPRFLPAPAARYESPAPLLQVRSWSNLSARAARPTVPPTVPAISHATPSLLRWHPCERLLSAAEQKAPLQEP